MKTLKLLRLKERLARGESVQPEKPPFKRSLLFEALEPRLLLSADGLIPTPTPELYTETLNEPGAVEDQPIENIEPLDEPAPEIGLLLDLNDPILPEIELPPAVDGDPALIQIEELEEAEDSASEERASSGESVADLETEVIDHF